MILKAAYGALLTCILAASVTAAPFRTGGDSESYETCLRLAQSDPNAALESALAWQDLGGSGAAQHCVAVTLFNLGQFAQAAERFERLADSANGAPPPVRAEMLAQAGTAWFRAENLERAYAVQSEALKLAPASADILIDRAMTLAGARNYWEAIDDLNKVISETPGRVDALILRASAYRFVDAMPLAREDAERAMRLAPERPEVLLEYGILQRLAGNLDEARKSWLKLIQLHEGTPAADSARRNLELLDVQVER